MTIVDYYQYLESVINIAKAAGDAIMQIYSTDFDVTRKEDNSPLTQADLAAHTLICDALNKLTPNLPILSEESELIDYESRKEWRQYWLIDPLDGTREFIKRNGEFSVNIAFIDGHKPVLGVVYAPVTELLYFASQGHGAYKQVKSSLAQKIMTKSSNIQHLTIAGSRSHSNEKTQKFLRNLESESGCKLELISMGSSLKSCLVAEGLADVYPRLGPTSEWDTAAAHCILIEAGGDVVDVSGNRLLYNNKQSLLNPDFFAKGSGEINWASYL
jgi:3'(2'), 5'-bisphosphate nucleotidase